MARRTRSETINEIKRVLKNAAVAVEGQIACVDTADGSIVAGKESTTLVPIGYFMQSFTGDGAKKIKVRLFREVRLEYFANDAAPNDIDDADFFKVAYLKDASTVSISSNTNARSIAGRIWGVDGSKVAVEPAIAPAEFS